VGLGAEPPATEVKWGFGGGSPDAETNFTVFSKKYAFLSILWSKLLLKNMLKIITKNVLLRPQGLRCVPPLAPPCYATAWVRISTLFAVV